MRSNTPPMTPHGANVPMAKITHFRQGMLVILARARLSSVNAMAGAMARWQWFLPPMWAGHVWMPTSTIPVMWLLAARWVSSVVWWWHNRLTMPLFYLGMKIKPWVLPSAQLGNVRVHSVNWVNALHHKPLSSKIPLLWWLTQHSKFFTRTLLGSSPV